MSTNNLPPRLYTSLKWVEKYIQTDMIYLFTSGFWVTIGKIANLTLSLILAIVLGNILSPTDYGLYKYVTSGAAILTIFSLTGIQTAVIQSVSQDKDQSFLEGYQYKKKWGILTAIISIGICIYYFTQENILLSISFLIVATFLPLTEAYNLYDSYLIGKKQFKKSSLINTIAQSIYVLIFVATLLITENILIILLIHFSTQFLQKQFLYKYILKKYQLNNNSDPDAKRYAQHLSLMNAIPVIAQQLDKVLLFQMLGAAPLAIFSFSLAPVEHIKSFFKNTQSIILPKISSSITEGKSIHIMRKLLFACLILSISTVFYIVIAPSFFKLFFPQYIESIKYSQIYAFSILATVLVLPLSVLYAKREVKELYNFNIFRSIFQLILMYILIKSYGILGAIIARITSDYANLIYLLLLNQSKVSDQ